MMNNFIRNQLAVKKLLSEEALAGWKLPELICLGWLVFCRLTRGLIVKARLGRASGIVLCDRRVRLYHARHISTGARLNLEEGCEIVGLSKQGIRFGRRCTVGRYATIRPTNVLVDEPGEGLRLGDNSNIGAYCYVGCSGYIDIGNNVMIGPRVNLMAENHNFGQTDVPMKRQGVTRSFIKIEDDCWLGVGSTILAGVTIGRGSIVAAGTVVTKDVPPYTIVGGVPAEVIKSRLRKET